MVEKLNLFRELLHKLADLVTDTIDTINKFKELFDKGNKDNEIEVE